LQGCVYEELPGIHINFLVHYLDNPHKLEYLVVDGEIIINNVSDGNE